MESTDSISAMDPLSITSTCLGLVKDVVSIVRDLSKWIHDAKGMGTTIGNLIKELNDLKALVESLSSCVGNPDVATAIQAINHASTTSDQSLWISIMALIQDCRITVKKYLELVEKVEKSEDRVEMVKKVAQEFQMNSKQNEASLLRIRLQTIFPGLSALISLVLLTTHSINVRENQQSHATTQQQIEGLANDQLARFAVLETKFDELLLAVVQPPAYVHAMADMTISSSADVPARPQNRLPTSAEPLSGQTSTNLNEGAGRRTDRAEGGNSNREEREQSFSDLKINLRSGLQQGKRIAGSIASASQASVRGGSVVTSATRATPNSTASLLAFQPLEYEAISESLVDANQSVMGEPLQEAKHSSIENWVPPTSAVQGPGIEQARLLARRLLKQSELACAAKEWKKALQSLQAFADRYSDVLDADEQTIPWLSKWPFMPSRPSSIKLSFSLGCLRFENREFATCLEEMESISSFIDADEDDDFRKYCYLILSRAALQSGKDEIAERYCYQLLKLNAVQSAYYVLTLVKDAQRNFAEADLYHSWALDPTGSASTLTGLSLADFWEAHVQIKRIWNGGDHRAATEYGLHFITRYLAQSIGIEEIDRRRRIMSSNLFQRGNLGLAASGKGFNLLHLLASDSKVSRWRETQLLLREGADVNARTWDRRYTALHFAATVAGDTVCARLCSTPGVDLDALNEEGDSPLTLAIIAGKANQVQMLRDCGAFQYFTVTSRGSEGTADTKEARYVRFEAGLHHVIELAAKNNQVDVVKVLVQDPQPAQGSVISAAAYATYHGHLEVVRLLLERGGLKAGLNDDGQFSAFHGLLEIALWKGDPRYATQILDLADEFEEARGVVIGFAPIAFGLSLRQGFDDQASRIANMRLQIMGGFYWPSIHPALESGTPAALLVKLVQHDDLLMIQEYIDAGRNVNATASPDDWGLMAAAKLAQCDCVRLLRRANANPHQVDSKGFSPLDYVNTMRATTWLDHSTKMKLEECRQLMYLDSKDIPPLGKPAPIAKRERAAAHSLLDIIERAVTARDPTYLYFLFDSSMHHTPPPFNAKLQSTACLHRALGQFEAANVLIIDDEDLDPVMSSQFLDNWNPTRSLKVPGLIRPHAFERDLFLRSIRSLQTLLILGFLQKGFSPRTRDGAGVMFCYRLAGNMRLSPAKQKEFIRSAFAMGYYYGGMDLSDEELWGRDLSPPAWLRNVEVPEHAKDRRNWLKITEEAMKGSVEA